MQIAISATVMSADDAAFVLDAERLGAASVWVAEAWGQDALTPLAFLAARTSLIKLGTGIAQLGTRSPALLAMSAMSMQALSGGRFLLGLGTSGPQVMEGWHGIRFASPVKATRETIGIVRAVAAGNRLDYHGDIYTVPLPDGPGRALRSMLPAAEVPIYVAALGAPEPRAHWRAGRRLDRHRVRAGAGQRVHGPSPGRGRPAGRPLAALDLMVPVGVEFTDDVEEAARRHARGYAFTIGAMGSRHANFYNAAFTRQGYGDDVRAVQDLWLAGQREQAADRVPAELGLKTNLLGPPQAVIERLRLYRDAGITTLQAKLDGDRSGRLDTLAQLIELARQVTSEPASGPPTAER